MPNGRPESDSESYAVPRMPRVAAAFQAAGRGFETRPPLHRKPLYHKAFRQLYEEIVRLNSPDLGLVEPFYVPLLR
jgi:hypothetical protein